MLRRDSICLEKSLSSRGGSFLCCTAPSRLVRRPGIFRAHHLQLCDIRKRGGTGRVEQGSSGRGEIIAEIGARFVVSALWSTTGPTWRGFWVSVLAPVLWSSTVFDVSRVSIGWLWVAPLALEVRSCAVSTYIFVSCMDTNFPLALVCVLCSVLFSLMPLRCRFTLLFPFQPSLF